MFNGYIPLYNGLRSYGLKYEMFQLSKANDLPNQSALISELENLKLPKIKVLLSKTGRVGNGARGMLDSMGTKLVNVVEYLQEFFDEPVLRFKLRSLFHRILLIQTYMYSLGLNRL